MDSYKYFPQDQDKVVSQLFLHFQFLDLPSAWCPAQPWWDFGFGKPALPVSIRAFQALSGSGKSSWRVLSFLRCQKSHPGTSREKGCEAVMKTIVNNCLEPPLQNCTGEGNITTIVQDLFFCIFNTRPAVSIPNRIKIMLRCEVQDLATSQSPK